MAAPRIPSSAAGARVDEERPRGDPWHAVGHLVAGVGLYGLLGWVLDRLLDTSWLVAVGILFGAVLGLYATWRRFMTPLPTRPPSEPLIQPTEQSPTETDPTRKEAR